MILINICQQVYLPIKKSSYKITTKICCVFLELTLFCHWNPWLKIINYRNIFLYQYCVQKCLMWIGPWENISGIGLAREKYWRNFFIWTFVDCRMECLIVSKGRTFQGQAEINQMQNKPALRKSGDKNLDPIL